jgi:hypothetical protein
VVEVKKLKGSSFSVPWKNFKKLLNFLVMIETVVVEVDHTDVDDADVELVLYSSRQQVLTMTSVTR